MKLNKRELILRMAENGFNYRKLSEASGVSRQTISTSIARKSCALETACKLASALNVDVSALMEENE